MPEAHGGMGAGIAAACEVVGLVEAVGAYGNTTALVGTAEQVAESMLAYYNAGVTTLHIRGFEPLPDAREYGRELIPLGRAEVAKRDRATAAAR